MAPMLQAHRRQEDMSEDSETLSTEKDIFEEIEEIESEADPLTQARSQARQASSILNSRPTAAQLAKLRSGYTNLLQTLKAEHRQLVEPQNDRLMELIEQANELHSQVQRTVDASLDARFMAASADLGAEKLHSLPKTSSPFTMKDLDSLLGRIVKSVGPDPFISIGKAASKHWLGVFGMETAVGLLDQETIKKSRTLRKKEERKEVGPATRPTVLTSEALKRTQHRETTDFVIDVYEQLTRLFEENDRISLFRLVCDPNSYARSVELLFYISFLVADNRLLVDETSDDVLISMNPTPEEGPSSAKKRHRIICTSMKDWRNAINRLSIKEPMIKLD